MKYDYLIVGAGLFGAVFCYEACKRGKSCLVIDRRNHTGGNTYCETVNDIQVHKYGAHIFHTSSKRIWAYVNQFVDFNRYTNSPLANYKGELYNLPFNMNTFRQLWGVQKPQEAKAIIDAQIAEHGVDEPTNLEEKALSLVGRDIYETLIKGYTEKQWGRKATELPTFIISRLPLRFTYDNNYFDDTYQGIPKGGYNSLTSQLLEGADIRLGVDYFEEKAALESAAQTTVYTGQIDEYFGFRFDPLEYRSLNFEQEVLSTDNFQGNAVVNYTEYDVPYTRIIEHKHFAFGTQDGTVITREYPVEWTKGKEPYYPINDAKNNARYKKYRHCAKNEPNVIFGGRLAEYQYYDMHQVIGAALKAVKYEFGAS